MASLTAFWSGIMILSVDVTGSGNPSVRGRRVRNPWANSNGMTFVAALTCVFYPNVT